LQLAVRAVHIALKSPIENKVVATGQTWSGPGAAFKKMAFKRRHEDILLRAIELFGCQRPASLKRLSTTFEPDYFIRREN
jgi:hypothetical protein